jgi:hypothetical protein
LEKGLEEAAMDMSKETLNRTDALQRKDTDGLWKAVAVRLNALAVAVEVSLTPERISLYLHALSDLPPEKVAAALESMVKTSRFFPKIVEIREAVLGTSPATIDACAEAAWMVVEQWILLNFDPDNGVREWVSPTGSRATVQLGEDWTRIPKLPPRSEAAVRAIGGYERVWRDVQSDQYTWMKREFCEAWKRVENVQNLLAIGPAGRKELPEQAGGFASAADILKALSNNGQH